MLDRKLVPPINLVSKIDLSEPVKTTLANGIEIYSLQGGEKEVLRIELVFDAGRYYEEAPIVASLTAKMLKEGTQKYDAKSIAESLDYYGATVQAGSNYDKTTISIYCLNRFLIPVMEVVEQIIYHPTFPEEELNKIVKRSLQKLKVNQEKTDYIASVKFRELFYGENHPYGYKVNEEHFNAVSVADLKKHYENYYVGNNAKVFVSGKFTNDELEIISEKFKQTRTSNSEVQKKFSASAYKAFKATEKKKNSLQAAIRIGKPVIERAHKDYYKLNVLNTVLGGYFGSRLMSNIREDKGYTYGISSYFSTTLAHNFMQISTEVNVDSTDDATNEIFKELKRLRTELVKPEELQLVKNYLTGRLMQSVDGPFKRIDTIKGMYLNNLKVDFFHDYVKAINKVTEKELLEVAQKYYQEEDFSVVIARN